LNSGLRRIFGPRTQIAVLALTGAYFLLWPLWRIPFPLEIAPNEGWNAYFADAAARGDALYPPPGTLIVNNYPPLSFYLIGYAQKFLGDALYIGRVLSLVATIGTGAFIYRIARQLGAGSRAAALASIWFVATMARSLNLYVGMNDPQIVAELIMVAALSWFLARDRRGKAADPAILLMVVAGFYKHNVVVIPATLLLWLLWRDGRRGLRPLAVGIGAVILGLSICLLLYGDAFTQNMLTPRPYSLMRGLAGLGRLQWILPGLAVSAIWMAAARRSTSSRFLALYVAIGLVTYFIQWTGGDVLDSAQFDLVIATAIALGLAFERIGEVPLAKRLGLEPSRALVMLLLIGRILATGRVEPMLLLTDPGYRAQFYADSELVRAEAALIAKMPGPIACQNKLVCRLAGKPYVYDDFRVEMMQATGAAKGMTTEDILRQHGLTFFANDPRSKIVSLERSLFKPQP
jgi:hypothetical protein